MTKFSGVLAIDPGIKATGWAIFDDGKLKACGVARATKSLNQVDSMREILDEVSVQWEEYMGFSYSPTLLVAERPQVYQQAMLKGDPNDLIPLAMIDGAIWERFKPQGVSFPLPREWKGQVPKQVMANRILDGLSKREFEIVKDSLERVPSSLRHNSYDAIGLGQWALKRFNNE
jgi:hypothetical protein